MNFDELLVKRRSVRRYKDQQVNLEELIELINLSTHALSAGNTQPWKFIFLNNKRLLKEISDDCKTNLYLSGHSYLEF